MTASNTQTLGTINGSPLTVDIGAGLGHDAPVKVTLNATLVHALPPGFPTPPGQTGTEVARNTSTFGSGTVLTTFPAEAARIKALGYGT